MTTNGESSGDEFEDEFFQIMPKPDTPLKYKVNIEAPEDTHIDQEIKSILSNTEPSGDYSLDADFRLG